MNRPYVICHMLTSINGKTTGSFLEAPETLGAIEAYETTNQSFDSRACLSGRLSMAEHFTHHQPPVLDPEAPVYPREDHIADPAAENYMVVVDTAGKLGWQTNRIEYMSRPPHHIVALLTGRAPDGYLAYLRDRGISYILAGDDALNARLALEKLKLLLGIEKIILSGGGVTNEHFLRAGLIDELSLVVAPVIGHDKEEIDLFQAIDANRTRAATALTLRSVETLEVGCLWLRYSLKSESGESAAS
ncbi:5-amino-6-(5-phosphoribosylamino)uracil reductase [Kaistia sp. 32K]|uniref:dihydrofolate reductase family protein n=1 Tax=Kaistia sp. 32K TaxID=2795690 RepID=UPI001916776F|nr:dihydrofolate reductase family protein [Kaistia sp. 32K]BCP56092.1 5-amino-6-(5-phosphoribosylamino)uracil reductase [Kaistia sp. 32K]